MKTTKPEMMLHYIKILLSILILLQCGCHGKFSDIGNPFAEGSNSSGVKSRSVKDITLSAKYLPPRYMAYQELRKEGKTFRKEDLDKATQNLQNQVAFVFTLDPQQTAADLAKSGVMSQQAYAERISTMSFNMEQYFSLTLGKNTLSPLQARYENIHDPAGKVRVILVFSTKELPKEASSSALDLKYEDPFWELGINHFVFSTEEINQINREAVNL